MKNLAADEMRFGFGKNWQNYFERCFSAERQEEASKNLLKSLMLENLDGFSFLDIGCGSGLHSLAAFNSGAKRIVSFDYDEDSVRTTKKMWELAGQPENWEVLQGSVLDEAFMEDLGLFDIVYSWGVLHHTGNMYDAIKKATIPLSPNGVFFIALYSDTTYRDGSLKRKGSLFGGGGQNPEYWLKVKAKYNSTTAFQKKIMEYHYVYNMFFKGKLLRPLRFIKAWKLYAKTQKEYIKSRGMDFWTDVRDWLGGWPMEFVKEQECIEFCGKLGLYPVQLNTGEGNTEFVFKPKFGKNYLDAVIASRHTIALPQDAQKVSGHMYRVALDVPDVSPNFTVFENGIPLAYRNALKNGIELIGLGRYRYENGFLFFSTSDNTSPIDNNRTYAVESQFHSLQFHDDYEELAKELITFARPYTMTSIERMYALYSSIMYLEKNAIDGDIVECGVWKGGSCMFAAKCLAILGNTNRKIYLYDTFEGMPEPTEKDVIFETGVKASSLFDNMRITKIFLHGESGWCESSLDEVKENMQKTGYPLDNIIFIKGKVEDTIPHHQPDKIALLRLDTDWYESTRCEMDYLYPKLSPNGILILDDYGYWKGAKEAVDDYFKTQQFQPLLIKLDTAARISIKPW